MVAAHCLECDKWSEGRDSGKPLPSPQTMSLGQSGRWAEGGEGGFFESSTREILVLAPQSAFDHLFV